MAPRRTRPGQGFSLYDLQEDIASTVDTLGDALSRQGVTVNKDDLLLRIQNVVQSIGTMNEVNSYNGSYPSLASDDVIVPYSVAGDLLTIAFEQFQNGDKREAVSSMLTAMKSDDFNEIASGLLEMNRLAQKSNPKLFANDDEDEDEGDDTVEDEEESESPTEDDNEDTEDSTVESDDLSADEIDTLIEDSESDNETTADDEDNKEVENKDTKPKPTENEEEEDEDNSESKDGDIPMGGTSSTIEASATSRAMANKISLSGDSDSRKRAKDFLKKNRRL